MSTWVIKSKQVAQTHNTDIIYVKVKIHTYQKANQPLDVSDSYDNYTCYSYLSKSIIVLTSVAESKLAAQTQLKLSISLEYIFFEI